MPQVPASLWPAEEKARTAAALARIESAPDDDETLALLDRAYAQARAHVIGFTGPPGVGKSTLLSALIASFRKAGRSVGVIAVDPSSKRTGGALLGDRVRIQTDTADRAVFVRSMAARDRLGGLAEITIAAAVVMRAIYDVVLIETVGVGQSETDVALIADTIVFCVQPGSGDSLQFMKAGIVEIPHVVVVTKDDLGGSARKAQADMLAALDVAGAEPTPGWRVPVLAASATAGTGISDLVAVLNGHADYLIEEGLLGPARHGQAEAWLREAVRDRFGRAGLRSAGKLVLAAGESPFRRIAQLAKRLGG
jgi:LAO/AO transport system kinase